MIAFLEGKIVLGRGKYIIVETGGIGYKVFLSRKNLSNIPESTKTIKLFCFHNVKEDASDLYGFLSSDEMDFFEMLMEIRGVGPKAALEIASLGSLEKIKDRIIKQDEKIFAGIPGIGTKKASAIILELTGKIRMLDKLQRKPLADPAEDALMQLGFSKQQVKEALAQVSSSITGMEERVKMALKALGKN